MNGLAALGDTFPDTILNILCEEYSDTSKKYNDDGHETRIKTGESLVRVTKILGKYQQNLLKVIFFHNAVLLYCACLVITMIEFLIDFKLSLSN